jgi:hypothetical protein
MAKKKSHEEDVRRGLEALGRSGIPVEHVSADLISQLVEQFGKARETDLGIVYLLGKIPAVTAAETLLALEDQATHKEVKKEIRRSLFKLGQKRITLGEEKRAPVPPPIIAVAPEIEAYMSAVDGSGGRLVWVVKPAPGHGLQIMQGMVSDREGLLRIGGAQVRRKELRTMAQEIKEKHAISMIPVPWEYADEILFNAYDKAKAVGRSGLENFHEIRSTINSARPKPREHPIYQKLESDGVRAGAWREQSRRLLDEPELRFWFLDEDWARPYLAQLEEAKTSRLVLNRMQQEERFAGIVRDAVRVCCAGEIGAVLARRMEDMSLYFLETNREALAGLALAVARQIREGDPGPLDISFLTGLVQKSFSFYLSQQTKQDEEPSLILKP